MLVNNINQTYEVQLGLTVKYIQIVCRLYLSFAHQSSFCTFFRLVFEHLHRFHSCSCFHQLTRTCCPTVCNNRKRLKTDLLSDRLPWRQLRLDGDEQRDEGPFGLTAQGVVAAVDAVAALLPVAQQHRRRVHLERSVDLADRTGVGGGVAWVGEDDQDGEGLRQSRRGWIATRLTLL